MEKKIIALIEGGYSAEAKVSKMSADTVYNNLDKSIYDIYRIIISKSNWRVMLADKLIEIDKTDFSFSENGVKVNFDCALIMIHGTPGEDGKLQAYFEMISVPYTTCSDVISTIAFNKYYCNRILRTFNFNCAKSVLLRNIDEAEESSIISELGLPCFVKPNDGGSSFGASKVQYRSDLMPAILLAFEHGKEVIIEEYLEGVEVTNGVIQLNGKTKALAITEIFTENEFFDYEAKYNGESQEITPARISDEMTLEIQSISELVYKKMSLKGIVRIDYMIVKDVPYIIEINTIPGQSSASLIPQQAAYAGITLKELYGSLIEDSLS